MFQVPFSFCLGLVFLVVFFLITPCFGELWTQQSNLNASDYAQDDNFGWSVSLSSSGDILAVGAYQDVGGVSNAGVVYVFTRNGTTWAQQAKLIANDYAQDDFFGRAVSLSSTGDILAIGAYFNAGAVYVFTRSGTTWIQQAKLTASDYAQDDYFGISVSLSSSGEILAIGANQKTVGSVENAGAVYVFTRSGTTWTEQIKLIASDYAQDDRFGRAVSLSATGDTLAIGASRKYIESVNAGAVYVFTRNGTTWTEQIKLIASDYAQDDRFGESVSLSSTGEILAIGANGKNVGSVENAGAAYVFTRNGTLWTQQANFTTTDPAENDNFGDSVSLSASGDILAIGAYQKNVGSVSAGAVYVFIRNGTTWTEQAKLTASDYAENDNFGSSLSLSSSGEILAIGANGKNVGSATQAGAVYVFEYVPDITTAEQTTAEQFTTAEQTTVDQTTVGEVNPITTNLLIAVSSSKGNSNFLVIGLNVAIVIIVLVAITIAFVILLKRKRRDNHEESHSIEIKAPTEDSEVSRNHSLVDPDHTPYSLIPRVVGAIPFSQIIKGSKIEYLGKGAFGIVYKAIYNSQEIAVKEINANIIKEEEAEAFIKEAEVMRSLAPHPNVLLFIGICSDPFCIVTEFMANGDLFHYLRKETINKQQEVKWMIDIATGMAHLAASNIVHRDLAARNCLLDSSLTAKVSDFGLSKIADESKAIYSKGNIGPLKWMSIEALQKKKYSEKSDVWSFGITCIEILTKNEPYPNLTAVQAVSEVMRTNLRPTLPESTKPQLQVIISSCWIDEPSSRPTFAELVKQLENLS